VSATADEREIKKAYRQLALKYHPDVSTIPDAHVKFLTIQQAYDLLTGKIRGKEVDFNKPSHGGWDFHDW
jgi:DnaJ-class molecular chaperone